MSLLWMTFVSGPSWYLILFLFLFIASFLSSGDQTGGQPPGFTNNGPRIRTRFTSAISSQYATHDASTKDRSDPKPCTTRRRQTDRRTAPQETNVWKRDLAQAESITGTVRISRSADWAGRWRSAARTPGWSTGWRRWIVHCVRDTRENRWRVSGSTNRPMIITTTIMMKMTIRELKSLNYVSYRMKDLLWEGRFGSVLDTLQSMHEYRFGIPQSLHVHWPKFYDRGPNVLI